MNQFWSVIVQRATSSKPSWKISVIWWIYDFAHVYCTTEYNLFINHSCNNDANAVFFFPFFEVTVRNKCAEIIRHWFRLQLPEAKQPDIIANDDSILTNPCLSSGYTVCAPEHERSSRRHSYPHFPHFCACDDLHLKGNVYFEIQQ